MTPVRSLEDWGLRCKKRVDLNKKQQQGLREGVPCEKTNPGYTAPDNQGQMITTGALPSRPVGVPPFLNISCGYPYLCLYMTVYMFP